MDVREAKAREHGELKVFLMSQEVALLDMALTWLRSDLTTASDIAQANPVSSVGAGVPSKLFNVFDSAIDATQQTLMTQSHADVGETENINASDQMMERAEKLRAWMVPTHEAMLKLFLGLNH